MIMMRSLSNFEFKIYKFYGDSHSFLMPNSLYCFLNAEEIIKAISTLATFITFLTIEGVRIEHVMLTSAAAEARY